MKNNYEIILKENNLTINNILNKFSSIINIEIKQLYFSYQGIYLSSDNNKRINEIKDNNIIIFVFNINIKKINDKELKHIICPECKNLSIINNNNDLFSFNNCINKHKFNDFNVNSFIEIQNNDESKIKCDKCKNNKSYYDKFYKSINGENICPLCNEIYKGEYKIIDYEYRFYI